MFTTIAALAGWPAEDTLPHTRRGQTVLPGRVPRNPGRVRLIHRHFSPLGWNYVSSFRSPEEVNAVATDTDWCMVGEMISATLWLRTGVSSRLTLGRQSGSQLMVGHQHSNSSSPLVVLSSRFRAHFRREPSPPAQQIEEYEHAIPGSGQILFSEFQIQLAHRRKMEKIVVCRMD